MVYYNNLSETCKAHYSFYCIYTRQKIKQKLQTHTKLYKKKQVENITVGNALCHNNFILSNFFLESGINIISSLQDCIASAKWHASSIEQGSKLRKTFKHLFPKGTMTSRSIGKSIKLAFPNQMLILNPHKLLKTPTHTREKMYFKLKSL
ncbi:unnamed protein product [Caretta caretta]